MPNDLKIKILRKLGNIQKLSNLSGQSLFQKLNFELVLSNFTGFLSFVPNILSEFDLNSTQFTVGVKKDINHFIGDHINEDRAEVTNKGERKKI